MTGAKGVAKFDNLRFSYEREVVTSTYDPLSNYVKTTTNQLGKTVSYENDAYGQAKSVTSPTGEVIRYAYDGQERLRTVTDNAGNLTTYIGYKIMSMLGTEFFQRHMLFVVVTLCLLVGLPNHLFDVQKKNR